MLGDHLMWYCGKQEEGPGDALKFLFYLFVKGILKLKKVAQETFEISPELINEHCKNDEFSDKNGI